MANYPDSRKGNTPGVPANPAAKVDAATRSVFDSATNQTQKYKTPPEPTALRTYVTRMNPRGPGRTA